MTRQPTGPLILALFVAIAPLLLQLPGWATLWSLLLWSYVLLQPQYNWPQPGRKIRFFLFCLGAIAVVLSSGMRFGGTDFVTLLAVMAGIKPLEVQTRRDSMVTVFLACFLTITSLLVFENLAMTLYLFVSVWVTTGVLIHVNDPKARVKEHFRLSARLVLMAVPLMVLLFFLFPRLSGSYLGTPFARQGHSGFSTILRIGDVSRIALSDTSAFSASFSSKIPKSSQLYWRGIVFQRFDGRSWSPLPGTNARQSRLQGVDKVQYTIMLEPHGYNTLFALDLPFTVNGVATIQDDHTLRTRFPVRQRFSYSAVSLVDARETTRQEASPLTLALPAGKNPLTVALGQQWAKEFVQPKKRMEAGLRYLQENGFRYTLQPGNSGTDPIDHFLFTSRKGFCEHFAASYAVLMRAAGIPTRIVGGYQGGRWNSVGKFFTVRQSDAHVWCELWFEREGWVRVDPTAVVAPERIEEALAQDTTTGNQNTMKHWFQKNWIEMITMTWEAINIRWDMWFMGFSAEDQLALLRKLGLSLGRQAGFILVMVLPSLFIFFLLGFRFLRRLLRRPVPQDKAQQLYTRFLYKTARAGYPKPPHLGPLDYWAYLAEEIPAMAQEVEKITRMYIALRYRGKTSDDEVAALGQYVKNFSIKKSVRKVTNK
nr:DUF3488 and transglutaminase-like domain-containing protein [uncultured Desulfobulbus sp.]